MFEKDNRYFDQLLQSTRERFLEYVRTHPQMMQRVPQKYIASYLNIKPETFSRSQTPDAAGKNPRKQDAHKLTTSTGIFNA